MMVGRWVSFWDSLFSGAMLNFGGVVCCLNLWPTLEIWDVAGRSALFSWATAEGKNAVYNSGNKAFEHITLLPLLPKQQNYRRNSEMRLNDNLAMSKKKLQPKLIFKGSKIFHLQLNVHPIRPKTHQDSIATTPSISLLRFPTPERSHCLRLHRPLHPWWIAMFNPGHEAWNPGIIDIVGFSSFL